jgi:small subunit ribosomal protein S16
MVTIRLCRSGSKKRPFYHVEVKDSRTPNGGRYIERLGYYNPNAGGAEQRLSVDFERVEYWKSVGATSSDRVSSLLKEARKQAAA